MTILRLELCVTVLLARWMVRMLKILDGKFDVDALLAWSDSQVALSWLVNSHTSFKVFISNRVHLVRQLIPISRWFYVRTNENPVDWGSRGLLPSELTRHPLYWFGPTYLKNPNDTWDASVPLLPADHLPEFKVVSLAV